jgi:hypothetical protein
MPDIVALFILVILFPLSLVYVHGCELLKGKRK